MAPIKEVPTLEALAKHAFQNFMFKFWSDITKSEVIPIDISLESIRLLKYEVLRASPPLHSRIASCILNAVEELFKYMNTLPDFGGADDSPGNRTLSTKCVAIAEMLASVACELRLEKLFFADWLPMTQWVVAKSFDKMKHIQVLICSFKIRNPELHDLFREELLKGCSGKVWSNLTTFSLLEICTDEIISVISPNCNELTKISAAGSPCVTDKCIKPLINCAKLQTVALSSTKVSGHGYFQLLTQTKSVSLEDIGIINTPLTELLQLMEISSSTTVYPQMKKIHCIDINTRNLTLVCKYFPMLSNIQLSRKVDYMNPAFQASGGDSMQSVLNYYNLREKSEKPDFSCLSSLVNLKSIELCQSTKFNVCLSNVLTVRGDLITTLLLAKADEMQINEQTFKIIGTYCPNLENFQIAAAGVVCSSFATPKVSFTQKPFQKLFLFLWSSNQNPKLPELVVKYACKIQKLHLAAFCMIGDKFFETVLKQNQLKELEELRVSSLSGISLDMIKRLIINCESLTSLVIVTHILAETEREYECVRNFIKAKNYDVNLKFVHSSEI